MLFLTYLSNKSCKWFYLHLNTIYFSVINTKICYFQNICFQFEAIAYDIGVQAANRKTSVNPARIQVTVQCNRFAPQFLNTPYGTTISASHPALTSVYTVTASDQDTRVCILAHFCSLLIWKTNLHEYFLYI